MLIMEQMPDLVIVQETRCSGSKAIKLIKKMGFINHILSEAKGYSGGIWLLWNKVDLNIQAISIHDQFVHVEVKFAQEASWFLTAIYASLRDNERQQVWNLYENFDIPIGSSRMQVGDYKETAKPHEKKGGAPVDVNKCHAFQSWINWCGLLDLGCVGTKFTWRGPKWEGRERIFKRLDRALCNSYWREQFHNAIVRSFPGFTQIIILFVFILSLLLLLLMMALFDLLQHGWIMRTSMAY